jgi:3-hydroxyacyl-CoA dehydrogenase
LKEEGRLLNFNPEMGVGHFPTIQYANMSQIDIFDKYMETIARLYSFETIRKKGEALFSNGAFTRPGEDISAFIKARLSWITLKEYLFTTDRDKKKLFWFIIKQIRSRRLAIDKGLGFLLSMLGYHRHILIHQKNMAAYREMIKAQNIGALNVSSQPDARSGSKIAKVGIVGEGKMGSGIFYHLMEKGVELVWITSQLADLEKLNRQIVRRRQRIKKAGSGASTNSDTTSSPILGKELSLLSDCDLVIEAIPEDAKMKKSLLAQLDMITKPEAILVSNTSSIKPSEIAPKGPRSENFAGLHFFYPVSMKNIVEINCGAETSTSTVERLSSFLNGIQRRYIVLNEANGFMLNKIFLDVQNEAWLLVHSGQCSISQIDQMVRNHLFTFGIFDFFDSVGIDTMYASIVNYTKDYPHRDCFASLTDHLKELVAQGKLGVKSGEGFYSYSKTESIVEDPQNVEDMVNHLRQTWLSSSKRFTTESKLTKEEANYAIREYFDLEKGPFDEIIRPFN